MVLLPLRDKNALLRIRAPFVTWALIAACVVAHLWRMSLSGFESKAVAIGLGLIPAVLWGSADLPPELARVPEVATLVTSQFLHGDLLHLAGNMLFLYIFGDNVEDSMGHKKFLLFYLAGGVVAGLAHAVVEMSSMTPMIGASGAVAGVLGAYLVLHPNIRVWTVFFVWIPMKLPVWIVLGTWLLFQFLSLGSDNVAWWAHIGGFLFGALAIAWVRHPGVPVWNMHPEGTYRLPLRPRRRKPPVD